jgi:hypothetical protein
MSKPRNKTPTRKITRNPITKLLQRAGITASEIATELKVSQSHIHKVCAGQSKSAKVEGRIETVLREAGFLKKSQSLRDLRAAA